ncbi:MAG: hypothetical protein JST00_44105 [Deltaproteobacteria bacterium]|nr:hypothetical protein [Deltaproteobacteria bacterium]
MATIVTARHLLRAAIALSFTALGVAAIAFVSMPACSDIPDKTCRGDLVNVFVRDGEADAAVDCTTCLQRQCCDAVGFCGETDECRDEVRDAQACVIANGARQEARCTTNIVDGNGKALYGCMREKCGHLCGVPSCTLDRSVILFGNARCDRCASSACCDEINACYLNRACKLTLECIITKCARSLGDGMNVLRARPNLDDVTRVACGESVDGSMDMVDDPLLPGGPNECIATCLTDFTPSRNETADDRDARCKAFKVYACSAKAGCGDECNSGAGAQNDGGNDASSSADASTISDANADAD